MKQADLRLEAWLLADRLDRADIKADIASAPTKDLQGIISALAGMAESEDRAKEQTPDKRKGPLEKRTLSVGISERTTTRKSCA